VQKHLLPESMTAISFPSRSIVFSVFASTYVNPLVIRLWRDYEPARHWCAKAAAAGYATADTTWSAYTITATGKDGDLQQAQQWHEKTAASWW
jgi:hypothetical protein